MTNTHLAKARAALADPGCATCTEVGRKGCCAPNGHYATITDFGDVCRVELTKWTDTITEDQARELGSALIGWAGRKRISRRAVGA